MPKSVGRQFPTRDVDVGNRHLDLDTGLIYRYLGGDPTSLLNWLVDGGTSTADPDTTGWDSRQAGARFYNSTLQAFRVWNGSSFDSQS